MPEIRDLGVINGEIMRGYEIDFETVTAPSSAYKLADGTEIRVNHTALKMFVLVDENDQPLTNERGEPKVLVEAAPLVASAEAGDAAAVRRAELDALIAVVEKEHAWLINELASR